MSIFFAPSALIYINNDISVQIQQVFARQFFATQIIDGYTADGYIAADGYMPDGYTSVWLNNIHADGYRVIVLRNLHDLTNRNVADIVLYAANGLVYIEHNKYGPTASAFRIDTCSLAQLFDVQKIPACQHYWRPNIYDQFKGHPEEAYSRDYDPNHRDWPPVSPEPIDE